MRLASLNKFKSGGRSILVATDVASRGLDIPLVDLVIVRPDPHYDFCHTKKAWSVRDKEGRRDHRLKVLYALEGRM